MSWNAKVKVKHLFTDEDNHQAIQASMNAVADVLSKEIVFAGFSTALFRMIPEGDEFFAPVDYANKLIDKMYNFADSRRIWIE